MSHRLRDDVDGTAYDQHSLSIIRLNNGTILYLREVNRFLALVCLLREDVFERQGLIEYNFHCFREAIQEVWLLLLEHLFIGMMSLSRCLISDGRQ